MSLHSKQESQYIFLNLKNIIGNIKNKTILDFGGNRGNLLYFSNGEIEQNNYTCIDVNIEAIKQGKKDFPDATFLHWNKFSSMYNDGNIDEPLPILNTKFDIAFAYSVITHTDWQEFKLYVDYLKQYANDVIISFINIDNNEMKEFFYSKRCNDYGSCIDFRKINDCDYFYLANNSAVIKDTEVYKKKCKHFINFYNKNFLLFQFKNSLIIDNNAQSLILI